MAIYSILIVDDEPIVLESLKITLEGENCIVYTAENSNDAYQVIKKRTIDLIISDQKMPGMSGLEFLEKTMEEYPDIVRILLTANANLQDAIQAVNSGCIYKFLLKPWDPAGLKKLVFEALEQKDLLTKKRSMSDQLKLRQKSLAELEQQYPGITQKPKDGIYTINTEEDL